MRLDSPWFAVAGIVLVVGIGFLLDLVDLPGAGSSAADEETRRASSGAWFCAAGDTAGGNSLRVALAAPEASGDEQARTSVSLFRDGGTQPIRTSPVPAGSATVRPAPGGGQASGVTARWWQWPVAVTRLWDPAGEGSSGRPVTGPCQSGPADRWVIPGMATAGGATGQVVLANPYDTDAAVQVAVATPEGLREPRRLENLAVPARSTTTVDLNQHAPAETDIGVIVSTLSGRVIAEGVQRLDAAIGGVDGASLAAGGQPATRWTVPWYRSAGDTAESWLWVTNPSDQPAAVTVSVHTSAQGAVPNAVGETTVGPGQVRRINLRNLVSSQQAAVSLVSENDVPVVTSAATRVDEGGEARTGLAVQLGAPAADPSWVLTASTAGDRRTLLHLVNPGGERAEVDVALWADGQLRRPDQLQGVGVDAGGSARLSLDDHLDGAAVATAFVTASSGEVVAGVEGYEPSGSYDLTAYAGLPSAAWHSVEDAPEVRREPDLTGRVGIGGTPTPSPTPQPGEIEAPVAPGTPTPGTPTPSPVGPSPVGPSPVGPSPAG